MLEQLNHSLIGNLLKEYPYVTDYFSTFGIKNPPLRDTFKQFVDGLSEDFLQDQGLSRARMLEDFQSFVETMEGLSVRNSKTVRWLTIVGGNNKYGEPENCSLTLKPGEIVCIVGPTGSGKSRLLADIECLAQSDTPTGRRVLIDGQTPDANRRFKLEYKLVAQLSQNMNFIMDLTVSEFIAMHAECRLVPDVNETVALVIQYANELAGERFSGETSLTQLSGGQSRALMIADTALLSASPIVLIDEIENAGVERKKALELLVREEKIVLMSTHDPILALMGHRRIVIKNGGIHQIIETSSSEKSNLRVLERMDQKMVELRERLRSGGSVDMDIEQYFELGEKNVFKCLVT